MEQKDKFKELFEKLKIYSSDKEKYISEIIDNTILILSTRRNGEVIKNEKLDNFTNYTKNILIDLYEDYLKRTNSKNNISEDIKYLSCGFTNIAIRVGDNVIKIGKSEDEMAPKRLDSVYQVPTYIRESYEIEDKNHFRVEVSPYVDTTNITYDDVYETYKNIRRLGWIWNDPKEENIGRIINTESCVIGSKKYLPKYEYKKGDLVAIDIDDIAYVGEITSDEILEEIAITAYNANVYKFENMYEKERKQKR